MNTFNIFLPALLALFPYAAGQTRSIGFEDCGRLSDWLIDWLFLRTKLCDKLKALTMRNHKSNFFSLSSCKFLLHLMGCETFDFSLRHECIFLNKKNNVSLHRISVVLCDRGANHTLLQRSLRVPARHQHPGGSRFQYFGTQTLCIVVILGIIENCVISMLIQWNLSSLTVTWLDFYGVVWFYTIQKSGWAGRRHCINRVAWVSLSNGNILLWAILKNAGFHLQDNRVSLIFDSHVTRFLLCCVILYDSEVRMSRAAPL